MRPNFKFIDLPTSAERLGVTRNQMLQWVNEGRIKPFSGSGQTSVFRAADVDRLALDVGLAASQADTPIPPDERTSSPAETAPTRPRRRDPIKLIGTRLSMDSRWAEISEADMAAWLDATEPVQFERVRKVAGIAIDSLQGLLAMMDEHERKLARGND